MKSAALHVKAVYLLLLLWAFALAGATSSAAQAVDVATTVADGPVQPLPFSHKKHAGNLHISCDYCHTKPDPGVQMTYPAAAKCMLCHATIAKESPSIQKLSEFAAAGKSIPWIQIYSVPGFVYWSHDVHLHAKVECSSCHGDVTQRDSIASVTNVTTMAGCVACHKQRNAPTGCMVCHDTQSARLLMEPLPAFLRRIIHIADGM